jgi:PQQ-dependent catabolism-associated beta-propeller protein
MQTLARALILFLTAVVALTARDPTGRLFVTNEGDDTVSVIDAKSGDLVKVIEIGGRPRGIGFSPDRTHVYVALGDDNAIGVIDTATLAVVEKIPAGSDPEAFAVHPNGHIYLSNEDDGEASVLNPENGEILAQIKVGIEPEGVAIGPGGTRVYVTSESTNMVHVVSVPEHEVVANILVGARPREIDFSADGKYGFVTCEVGGEVVKWELETNKIVQRKKLRREIRLVKPKGIRRGPDDKSFFIATGRGDVVAVLDADTLDLQATIPVGRRVWGMAFSRDGKMLYVTNGLDNDLSVIDVDARREIKRIPTGEMPWGVIFDD